jgi:hypothetical protein
MNIFVDPDAPYREDRLGSTTEEEAHGLAWQRPLQDTPKAEADTLIGMPLFAPVTRMNLEPLPAFLRPAGLPSVAQPRRSADPMAAVSGMPTVFGRSPFLGPRVARRDKPKIPDPRGPSYPRAMEFAAIRPPAADPPMSAAKTTSGHPLPKVEREDEGATVLVRAVKKETPARLVEAWEGLAEDPQQTAEHPPPETASVGPSAGFWTDEVPVDSEPPDTDPAEERDSAEVPALDVAFYTSEVEALDWGRGASVVPWGTLTALSARTDFEESAGRIILGPGEAPPPPSMTAIEGVEVEAGRRVWLYAGTVVVSALGGAAIALLAIRLMG